MQASDDTSTSPYQDPLRNFKQRTLDHMTMIGFPFVALFGFWQLYQGNYAVGFFMLLFALSIAFRSYRGYQNKQDSLIIWILTGELMIAMLFGLASVGVLAAFWSYPLFFVLIFLWPRRESGIGLVVALGVLLPAAFVYLDNDVAIRLSITLLLFCYMGYQLVGILMRMQNKLESQAIKDPLTGAYNRRYMTKLLKQSTEEARRGLGSSCLVAMDIDNFKSINDTLGHEAGDTVLKNLVTLLNSQRRKVDSVCRIGGEEFIILLRNTDAAGARVFAERLRQTVENEVLLEGRIVTLSIGVAELSSDDSEDEWLKRADDYMYQAKQSGKNQVQPAPDMSAEALLAAS